MVPLSDAAATIITLEIPADFEGEATFTVAPNPEPERLLTTSAEPPAEA